MQLSLLGSGTGTSRHFEIRTIYSGYEIRKWKASSSLFFEFMRHCFALRENFTNIKSLEDKVTALFVKFKTAFSGGNPWCSSVLV